MMTMPAFVDMAMDPEETKEVSPMPDMGAQPIYPWGLSIRLTQDELEKLDMEDECEVGDLVCFKSLAKVTSVTKNDTTEGSKTNIELQIIGIELDGCHDEDDEDTMPAKIDPSKMYKG